MFLRKKLTHRNFLLTVAFISGMSIMGIELSASRLIAPFYGTSTFIWTNVIGVIMIALSLGYYAGGTLADRNPNERILYKLILFASCVTIIVPFITSIIADLIDNFILLFSNPVVALFLGSLLIMIVLFFVPIFILAFTSPFIIKLLSMNDEHIGNNAGSVFAISTIGSIIGTFTPVLIFIPTLGTRKTIVLFSLLLIIIAIIGLTKKKALSLLILVFLPLIYLQLPPIKHVEGALAEQESVYQYMQVVDQGSIRHALINEGNAVYSSKNMEGILTGFYYDYYSVLPHIVNKKKQDILLLGLAAGTISSQIIDLHSDEYDITIDGVEIDKMMIDIGYKYFDMARDGLNVINQDGRVFINRTDKTYDLAIIDTYAHQLYIAFQLTTQEFFQSVKARLNPDGIVAFNVNAINKDSKLLNAITNTMNTVFDYVYLTKTGTSLNWMVMGSDKEISMKELAKKKDPNIQNLMNEVIELTEIYPYNPKFIELTDDKAPIEHLTDFMVLEFLKN